MQDSSEMQILFYSLRSILLFANTDVSTTKIYLDTSILAKSIIGRREYLSFSLLKRGFFLSSLPYKWGYYACSWHIDSLEPHRKFGSLSSLTRLRIAFAIRCSVLNRFILAFEPLCYHRVAGHKATLWGRWRRSRSDYERVDLGFTTSLICAHCDADTTTVASGCSPGRSAENLPWIAVQEFWDTSFPCSVQSTWSYYIVTTMRCDLPSHLVGRFRYKKSKFVLPPYGNIRCFSFVKLMYLDIF
jgi:hypothetical protein